MMSRAMTIFALGDDILYLIFKEIQYDPPRSLHLLAMASKECGKLVGPILYRSVTLSDKGDERSLSQMRALFERLLKEDDHIHDYIRELIIAEWGDEINHTRSNIPSGSASGLNVPWDPLLVRNGESKLMGCSQLESMLKSFKKLEAFSWNAMSLIPERVISKLEEYWPAAKLSVTNDRRRDECADRPMDVRLLSSPLLHSLDYSILYGYTSSGIVCSEFRQLKDILVRCPYFEVLSLAVYAQFNDAQVSKTPLDWHQYLPVGPGDPLTTLHTLTIPERGTYSPQNILKLHSAMFNHANDFTNLKRLDLRNLCITYSFEPLLGRVPNLKHLDFFFGVESQARRSFPQQRCRDGSIVRDFLQSIESLRTLKITNDEDNFDILWPSILKHRDSLQQLSTHTRPDHRFHREQPPVLNCDQLGELQESKYSDLAFDVLIADIAWFSKADHGHNDHDLNPSKAVALANFNKVEILKLYVELPTDASLFSIEYHYNTVDMDVLVPPLEKMAAKEVAVGLFQQIFIVDPKAALRELEICFCRLQIGDMMDSWIVHNSLWVRKREIDYINKPKKPGYAVEFHGNWEEPSA